MPHFADPAEDLESTLPSEVDLPRERYTRVAADDDANVFSQVVARPKPPVEPPATRERLVEVETAAEEARLLAQRAAADLYDAAAQVELARAPSRMRRTSTRMRRRPRSRGAATVARSGGERGGW